MKRRRDKEPNGEGLEPDGNTDSSDRHHGFEEIGSWTDGLKYPTGDLEITETNGNK
jgi:hypothetical protein